MQSINFEFLRPRWPELASLGGFAEAYAHGDPIAALVKLRTFGEQMAAYLYHHLGLPRPYRPTLIELLDGAAFQQAVPRVIVTKFHSLRVDGNRAAHGNQGDTRIALRVLKDAYDLGRWLFVTYAGGAAADCPTFAEPPSGGVAELQRRREKRAILERVAAQEAEMQRLLADLDTARARAQQAESTAAELAAARATAEHSLAALAAINPLDFDEAATRRQLIDRMLADAGWPVPPGLASNERVAKEVRVEHQPTESGIGYADYVLFDEAGKPLAVIEAKKTVEDAEKGRTQAQCYADGLERMHGQRPIIFYTNGYDLWIYNDIQREPPRKLFGFYSPDSLQCRHFQGRQMAPISQVAPNPNIAGRMYQMEAVRRIAERFAEKKRKALIVQATGTGKTRVAVSLCDALIRAKWARRILFLCDRRELRKQANNAFKEYLPSEPRTIISADTAEDRDKRVYLATYPAMMKCYEKFDAGFFDLIIADESHRSVYNRYRELFYYFDALQVGLTATPIKYRDMVRNTFKLFGCEDDDPTSNFDYREAIEHNPPFLVPFEVESYTTPFLREGIKYSKMSKEQREQLDGEEPDPAAIEHDREEVDKRIFNKDTNRHILRNLMEHGVRDATGSRVGKSIIFARSHQHAMLLQGLFENLYPQYGGDFCRVIDNYDPRAEELIDDFKGIGKNRELTIAISVDMLDTGIDVPEIVNLVFAKPVYSPVKFWQMIGRGTRLCPGLFGSGKDKTHFLIFDHWENFERFDEKYTPAEAAPVKSLMQQVFESRVALADAAVAAQDTGALELAVSLIEKDLASLPEKTIAVREKWRDVKTVARPEVLKRFDAATRAVLLHQVAPLMQWVNIAGREEAYQFDNLVCKLQTERLKGSGKFDDLKSDAINAVSQLPINLSQVAGKARTIERMKRADFWTNATVETLEQMRGDLRGVMQYRQVGERNRFRAKVIDVTEDGSLVERKRRPPVLDGLELAAYRNRVLKVLTDLFETNNTLKRIRAGLPVNDADLTDLVSLVLAQEPDLDLTDLTEYYPESAGHLDQAIRGIIGLDAQAVHERFTAFVHQHPALASHQIKFLDLLQNHISRYGSIEIERLYEPPFTLLHSDGLDGVFDEPLAREVLAVVQSFRPPEDGVSRPL